ncbi:MAG: nicotinate phosphoribosyltransferase [Gemmatimonadota bacterium]
MHRDNMGLLVDLYQLTMLQAYHTQGMFQPATFTLFCRRLPESRNFLLACGLDDVLSYLEGLHFPLEAVTYLEGLGGFTSEFLEWLSAFRFSGRVRAVPEGTPVFRDEPILEIEAPLPEAQVVETFVMNQIHLQTVLASKAVRVKLAAGDRAVVDFGIRRMHGADAALKSARAYHIGGLDATSNVLAGQVYGVRVTGTMAHSYIQAHDDELEAFREFARSFPETTLLVDSYDTLEGVRNVVRLAGELGSDFRVRAIRLDSGDLGELARGSRRILDEGGLQSVKIFASGGLDEWSVRELGRNDAPIQGFGVGTGMGVSRDAPSLDLAYKLVEYAGEGRLKLSPGKPILPGAKQIFRQVEGGQAVRDIIGREHERLPGRPLMKVVMENGVRLSADTGNAGDESDPSSQVAPALEAARAMAAREMALLPPRLLELEAADPPYVVEISHELEAYQKTVTRQVKS